MDDQSNQVSNEVAATAAVESESYINSSEKPRKFFKRKLLISCSALILFVIVGLIGSKYYFNYQERQRELAESKAALESALTASMTAFDSAQLELTPNSYKDAINDLKKVIPEDSHYAQAQKQISLLNSVSDLTILMQNLNTDMTKFNSALQQFDSSYESLRQPINSAAEYIYPASTTIGMSHIGKADTLYKEFSNSAGNVTDSVTAISNDLGLISSNGYLSSFGSTTQILANFQNISLQTSNVKSAAWNQIDSMKRNYFDYTYVTKVNSSINTLSENVVNAKQGISALTGFANGKINDLLKDAEKLNQ